MKLVSQAEVLVVTFFFNFNFFVAGPDTGEDVRTGGRYAGMPSAPGLVAAGATKRANRKVPLPRDLSLSRYQHSR